MNQYIEWGRPLGYTEVGWLERFELMEQGKGVERNQYVTWWASLPVVEQWTKLIVWFRALVPRNDPGTTDLLCHFETFQGRGLIREGDSKVHQVISYGLASVYTPGRYRGKGYARHTLQLAHYLIAPDSHLPPFPIIWGEKPDDGPMDADFSVLHSGIGDGFYGTCRQGHGASSRIGWIRQPVTTRTWDVSRHRHVTEGLEQKGWSWLSPDDLREPIEQAAQGMRERMATGPSVSDGGDDVGSCSFAIEPDWYGSSLHCETSWSTY